MVEQDGSFDTVDVYDGHYFPNGCDDGIDVSIHDEQRG